MSEEESKKRKSIRAYAQAGNYITLGLQFSITIMLCLFAGRWVDGKLDTEPLFLLFGTFFGAGAGLYTLYKGLVSEQKENEEGEDERCG